MICYYPHVSIGKVWIYHLLFFFIILCVCTVTDFSAEDKARGVKFCMAVYWHPLQGISHLGELCFPRSPIAMRDIDIHRSVWRDVWCCSSLDNHDVGSLSVTAWPADEQNQFIADAFTSLQVPSAICDPANHNSPSPYDTCDVEMCNMCWKADWLQAL